MNTKSEQFKINFRHSYQAYELNVKLLIIDSKKEQWRVWNNAVDVTIESNRPHLQSRPGFKHRLPQWSIVKGALKPESLIYSITDGINKHMEVKKGR